MVKYFLIFVLAFVLTTDNVQALSNRVRSGRGRLLARQQVASNPTPYPSAAELKPEVPFEETAAAALPNTQEPDLTYGAPDVTYGAPDPVYGPPQSDEEPALQEEQLPSENPPEEFAPQADVEEFSLVEINSGSFSRLSKVPERRQNRRKQLNSARLRVAKIQQQRQPQRQQKPIAVRSKRLTGIPLSSSLVSAPVSVASIPTTVVSQPLQVPQYFVLNQPFSTAYTAQYLAW